MLSCRTLSRCCATGPDNLCGVASSGSVSVILCCCSIVDINALSSSSFCFESSSSFFFFQICTLSSSFPQLFSSRISLLTYSSSREIYTTGAVVSIFACSLAICKSVLWPIPYAEASRDYVCNTSATTRRHVPNFHIFGIIL